MLKLLKILPIQFRNFINLRNFSQNLQLTTYDFKYIYESPTGHFIHNMTHHQWQCSTSPQGSTSVSTKNFTWCILVYQSEITACSSFFSLSIMLSQILFWNGRVSVVALDFFFCYKSATIATNLITKICFKLIKLKPPSVYITYILIIGRTRAQMNLQYPNNL